MKIQRQNPSIIDRYKNHLNVCKIKSEVSSQSCSDSDFCCSILVTCRKVEKMLKFLNLKRGAGIDCQLNELNWPLDFFQNLYL